MVFFVFAPSPSAFLQRLTDAEVEAFLEADAKRIGTQWENATKPRKNTQGHFSRTLSQSAPYTWATNRMKYLTKELSEVEEQLSIQRMQMKLCKIQNKLAKSGFDFGGDEKNGMERIQRKVDNLKSVRGQLEAEALETSAEIDTIIGDTRGEPVAKGTLQLVYSCPVEDEYHAFKWLGAGGFGAIRKAQRKGGDPAEWCLITHNILYVFFCILRCATL